MLAAASYLGIAQLRYTHHSGQRDIVRREPGNHVNLGCDTA
jgi:hypothetical protein